MNAPPRWNRKPRGVQETDDTTGAKRTVEFYVSRARSENYYRTRAGAVYGSEDFGFLKRTRARYDFSSQDTYCIIIIIFIIMVRNCGINFTQFFGLRALRIYYYAYTVIFADIVYKSDIKYPRGERDRNVGGVFIERTYKIHIDIRDNIE